MLKIWKINFTVVDVDEVDRNGEKQSSSFVVGAYYCKYVLSMVREKYTIERKLRLMLIF